MDNWRRLTTLSRKQWTNPAIFRCLHLYLELDNPSPLRYQSTLISASNYPDDMGGPEPVESLPQLQVNGAKLQRKCP